MIERNNKYKRIAERLIARLPEFEELRGLAIRIVYLSSDEEKKKNNKIIYGDCTKVSPRYSWTCPYDFMITIYEPNVLCFDKKQIETLIRHELHHVGIDYSGNEPRFYVVPHDIEEFNDIINDVGLYWDI